jgi:ppGpp synthetase/RelA/SpoT-type nucleotidyltranferase
LARAERTVEDRLREEYFDLLPDIRRAVGELEAEVKHCLLPISRQLNKHEQLIVTSRVKECESAIEKLRSRAEGATFDQERAEVYTLTSLNDLAGVRVAVFPRSRLAEADWKLRERFPSWTLDPVRGYDDAMKYHGYCRASDRIRAEFQTVPMLTARFWDVEHSAIYKPSPRLKRVAETWEMQQRTRDVLKALKAFEDELANLIQRDPQGKKKRKNKKRKKKR